MPPAPDHITPLVPTTSKAAGLEESVALTNIPTVPDERNHRLDGLHVPFERSCSKDPPQIIESGEHTRPDDEPDESSDDNKDSHNDKPETDHDRLTGAEPTTNYRGEFEFANRIVDTMAEFDTIAFIWEALTDIRTHSPLHDHPLAIGFQGPAELDRLARRLEIAWRWTTSQKHAALALFFYLYTSDEKRFEEGVPCTGGGEANDIVCQRYGSGWCPTRFSVDGKWATMKGPFSRMAADMRFRSMAQTNTSWMELFERYGAGIFPLLPDYLQEDSLRLLTEAEFKILVSRIDIALPGLKDDLTGLSDHILCLLDHDTLPPGKLQIEMLSKDELNLLRSRGWSLKELFQPAITLANNSERPGISSK